MVVNGTWHFHCMQYRVMNTAGKYALCDCTGYRLDGTDTEPNMYVGIVTNRSLADTTDSVTGLGDIHALVNAIGEMRRVARNAGLIAIKIDEIAQVNARFGFDAGDRVLAESASWIARAARVVCSARPDRCSWRSLTSLIPKRPTRLQTKSNGSWDRPCSLAHLNISRPFAWRRFIWTPSTDSPFPF